MKLAVAFFVALTSAQVHASLDAPLSEATGELLHPVDDSQLEKLYQTNTNFPSRSDVMGTLGFQTAVKFQGQRNTCTVFAIVGAIEANLRRAKPEIRQIDLSEQWVQYLAALGNASGGAKGSTVATNYAQLKKFGLPNEKTLPYQIDNWTASSPSAQRVCDGHANLELAQCLSSQLSPRLLRLSDGELENRAHPLYNPRFAAARREAKLSLATLTPLLSRSIVSRTSEIKQRLLRGESLALEANIFFGAWNHSGGKDLGIESDADLFARGIVTYPEKGSVDRARSPEKGARHAVVIVGYDDSIELTYTKKMSNGETKTFTRRGVYYFKNSWNKAKFGSKLQIAGKRVPGFGMMAQDYAHEFGQFTAISVDSGADL